MKQRIVLAKIKEAMLDRNVQAVAKSTGLSPLTLYKIVNGSGGNYNHSTIKLITDYLGIDYEKPNGTRNDKT